MRENGQRSGSMGDSSFQRVSRAQGMVSGGFNDGKSILCSLTRRRSLTGGGQIKVRPTGLLRRGSNWGGVALTGAKKKEMRIIVENEGLGRISC